MFSGIAPDFAEKQQQSISQSQSEDSTSADE